MVIKIKCMLHNGWIVGDSTASDYIWEQAAQNNHRMVSLVGLALPAAVEHTTRMAKSSCWKSQPSMSVHLLFESI